MSVRKRTLKCMEVSEMKYIELTKSIWNSGDHSWSISVWNSQSARTDKYLKNNKLAEKLEKVLSGEADFAEQNGQKFELSKTQFKADGFPVFIVTRYDEYAPCALFFKKGSSWKVDYHCSTDEDMQLFEKYGYTVKDIRPEWMR